MNHIAALENIIAVCGKSPNEDEQATHQNKANDSLKKIDSIAEVTIKETLRKLI